MIYLKQAFYFSPDPDDTDGGSSTDDTSSDDTSTDTSDSDTSTDDTSTDTSDSDTSTSTDTSDDSSTTDSGSSSDDTSSSDSSSDDTSSSDSSTDDTSSSDSSGSSSDDTSTNSTDTTATTSDTDKDSEGFRVLDSGSWNGDKSVTYQGGQVMHFQVKNVNVLGTTLSISSNLGGKKSQIILPQQTADLRFDCFGSEPMGWSFDISTNSDAFIVAYKIYSSWIPGDPRNG